MKKRLFSVLGVVMGLTAVDGTAQTVTYKHNKDLFNQFASMEYKQYSFTPKSDYYSKVREKVLFVSFDVPGNGWHDKGYFGTGVNVVPNVWAGLIGEPDLVVNPDKYVNEKWRMMATQRLSAVLEAGLQKNYITTEDAGWEDIRTGDLLTIADRSGNTPTSLVGASAVEVTSNDRNAACRAINYAMHNINEPNMQTVSRIEYERIQSNITQIRSAHMDDARKAVALTEANNQLEELKKKVHTRALFCHFMDSVVYVPGKGLGNPAWKESTHTESSDSKGAFEYLKRLLNFNNL